MTRLLTSVRLLIWLAFGLAGPAPDTTFHLINFVFLLAPLLLVPSAVKLLTPPSADVPGTQLWFWLAVGTVISFCLPSGWAAGLLALPWLVGTIWMAHGVALRRGGWTSEEVTSTAAVLFIVVGSAWLVVSRLGWQPLGFDPVIVLLTAVHFHFAGFTALTVIVKLKPYAPRPSEPLYRLSMLGAVAGTPVLAVGTALSPLLELIGAAILTASMILVAGLLIFVLVPEVDYWPAQTLLGGAAGFLAIGMVLAAGYAVAQFEEFTILPVPLMAALHGVANGIGFCGLGIGAVTLLDQRARQSRG